MQSEIILETRDLRKEFNGFVAVDGVNLRIRRGHIHALIGANGAGKTTCFNLLTRFLAASGGSIHLDGQDITHTRPQVLVDRGLVRSFQISSVFAHLTALENVRLGLQRALGLTYHFWRSKKVLDQLDERAMGALEQVGLAAQSGLRAGDLPYGRKRALELATTLAVQPQLMLLDEPTQGMGHEDVGRVTELIRKVAAGRTVLMVEHNMNVVAGLCDRITVMQRGRILAEGSYAQVSCDERVRDAYMGRRKQGGEVAHG
ncbi:Daunorubicin/doxorubicin resistance ATP-binding protein DrrA [Delftia tsuruhatensis]|uniref:ABC transporter ATP-binding protein n=1 Tax=Delftia tsuruhatensis TaxID=180282 RepID=UPI001E728DAE|nr:ABC transporter ATP-binding protein [Delftia tsuruhatensis]CAB5695117.1 Daunorubicin/doxorubicin resistance ATP-binding protein DrrA [Delftia tsuruhatensis]CAC9687002.1 Daunorubicin/doxorubicin resistance ATP-binding protein DrrA [Delftia tsuruhatensis]